MNLIVTTPEFDKACAERQYALTEQRKNAIADVVRAHYAKHGPAITNALRAVNGKAASFAITDPVAVVNVAERAEALLTKRGVTKANRKGARVVFCPAGPSASAYKYGAKSTQIVLERNSQGWRLVEVTETKVYPRSGERFGLTVSEAAAADITRHAFDGIHVACAVKTNAK